MVRGVVWNCIRKMMLWKCCTQYASKFGKLSWGHRPGKCQFSFQSQWRAMPKNAPTTTLYSSHMLVSNAQNSSSQGSAVYEPWTPRCSSWFYTRQRNQRPNCKHPLDHQKSKRVPEKISISALLTVPNIWLCESSQIVENSERDGTTRPPDLSL